MDALQIVNLALGWLGSDPASSLDDDARPVRLMVAAYDGLRDALLEERDWSFALGRLSLVKDPVAPASWYPARYLLPSTMIRVVRAKPGGEDSSLSAVSMASEEEWPDLDWVKEAGTANADGTGNVHLYVLAATEADSLIVQGILRGDDTTIWSPGFCQALATRLAADNCVAITQDKVLAERLQGLAQKRLEDAAANDGRQGSARKIQSNYFRRSRA